MAFKNSNQAAFIKEDKKVHNSGDKLYTNIFNHSPLPYVKGISALMTGNELSF